MKKFNLAARLSKFNLNAADIAACENGLKELKTIAEQKDFFDYCNEWKLAPWVSIQLKKQHLANGLDESVIANFEAEHDQIKSQNERRNVTAAIFLKAFKQAGIDVAILKGNYLAHHCYQDIGYKRMNDFDILIKREDWDKIQDIYLELGYIPLGFGWSGEKEKPASFSHVGMSFISKDYSCIIGSQWGLKSPTTKYTVNIDAVWKTAQPFNFLGLEVKRLSTEYNLLHLMLHLGVFKCGIRDCMDLYNLIRTECFDEGLMQQILIESNAIDKAKFALEISNLCTPEFSQSFIDGLAAKKNGFLARRLLKRKRIASLSGDFQISYNDYFQDIEKQVIYFNLYPPFHIKLMIYLRILKMIYFPKLMYALKLNDKAYQPTQFDKFISRVKAPYFVFSLIAQEIGWKFTFLLFIKLLVDLIISVKNYFVRPQSYFDYLKGKGINPKDIQNAVKNIQ